MRDVPSMVAGHRAATRSMAAAARKPVIIPRVAQARPEKVAVSAPPDEPTKPLPEPLLVETAEACRRLSVSPGMLRALERRGLIAACRIGRKLLWHVDELSRCAAGMVGKTVDLSAAKYD